MDMCAFMQEAALEGASPQLEVAIVTGGGRRRAGRLSLKRTVRSHLWAMSSPFKSTEKHEGSLVARGYSEERWVKVSNAR